MTNLVKWLFEKNKDKKKIAISIAKEKISYQELYQKIIETSQMISQTIGKERNILLVSGNSIFFAISYLSIIGSGNICVPLKYDKNMNLKGIKEETESENIFIQKKYLGVLENLKFKSIITEENFKKKSVINDYQLKEYLPTKIAVIVFTSGTTGEPKGVMLTHNNIIKNTDSIIDGLFLTEGDKIMVVLPFYYCFGATLLHTHLRVGAEIVINNNFLLPQKIVEEMLHKQCTEIAGVPTIFHILLRQTKIRQTKFPHIRCVQQSGGKLTNPYLKELVNIFGYDRVFVMYGLTEATSRLCILNPKYLKTKFGSVGKGIKGTKLKILNSDLTPTKIGEPGEIYATGENIMAGYYKDERETKKKMINGMLKTGDIAMEDKEGFIYILDRESNFIKSRGYRIGGKIIEQVIAEIPEVVEVAVVGIEDNLFGEKIVAYISTNKKVKKKEILSYCNKKLQNHELPAEIILLQSLPKNNSFKIDYKKLKKEYEILRKNQEQND